MRSRIIQHGPDGREAYSAYLLLLPLLLLVSVFVLYPVAGAWWGSLFRDVSFLPKRFVGLDNSGDLLSRGEFWRAARSTVQTVRENIAFPLTNLKPKPSRDEIAARVEQVASRLQVRSLLDRKPAELSGGQRQRVAIGRALGITTVYVTHDQIEAGRARSREGTVEGGHGRGRAR